MHLWAWCWQALAQTTPTPKIPEKVCTLFLFWKWHKRKMPKGLKHHNYVGDFFKGSLTLKMMDHPSSVCSGPFSVHVADAKQRKGQVICKFWAGLARRWAAAAAALSSGLEQGSPNPGLGAGSGACPNPCLHGPLVGQRGPVQFSPSSNPAGYKLESAVQQHQKTLPFPNRVYRSAALSLQFCLSWA